MERRLAALTLLAAVLLSGSCSNGSNSPTSPSPIAVTPPALTRESPATAATPSPLSSAMTPLSTRAPGSELFQRPDTIFDTLDVVFPPRDQTFGFGLELNALYRDQLRRSPVTTFVDLEGWIVWVQEYLRYRVNGCSNFDASFRVGVQIGGGGVPPVCAVIPPGVTVPFPPRNESFSFGQDLNNTYRDQLRRSTVSAFVDLEGWIVWISEYLRYRTSGCSHNDASFRVGVQIGGGGVPAACSGPTGPGPGPTGGTILVRGGGNACSCWIGPITVQIDGVTRGSLTCSSSLSVPVSAGTHTVQACDSTGCVTETLTVGAGSTEGIELTCRAGLRGMAQARP